MQISCWIGWTREEHCTLKKRNRQWQSFNFQPNPKSKTTFESQFMQPARSEITYMCHAPSFNDYWSNSALYKLAPDLLASLSACQHTLPCISTAAINSAPHPPAGARIMCFAHRSSKAADPTGVPCVFLLFTLDNVRSCTPTLDFLSNDSDISTSLSTMQ